MGGAINITNRLNASVASFPDPGIVTSFVAGIEGAKTIPPCLIVVSTEIQVSLTMVITLLVKSTFKSTYGTRVSTYIIHMQCVARNVRE